MNNRLKMGLVGVAALALVFLAVRSVWHAVAPAPVPADYRTLKDAENGELFKVRAETLTTGYPYKNPKTGRNTLYPTEICYANECGKHGGTYVILNQYLKKPGPTKCPKCGARVVAHNPGPKPSPSGTK